MFKESEAGSAEINHVRAAEAIDTQATIIAAACPFCNTMMTDGVKKENKDTEVSVLDLAEIIHQAQS
jgi:heterodisulfide reductase subunit D